MFRSLSLAAVAMCGIFASVKVKADIPLPADEAYIQPTIQFLGIDEHPDYIFQIRYLTSHGAPRSARHRSQRISDSKPFVFDVERRIFEFQILAIKRADFTKIPRDNSGTALITAETDGVLSAKLHPPSTVAKKGIERSVHQYKVEVRDGELTVKTESKSKSGTTGGMSILGGLSLTCGLIFAGLRFAWKLRRWSRSSEVRS